jgi:hypothetical protein
MKLKWKWAKKFAVTTDLDTDTAVEKDWYTLYQFTGKTDQILVFISNQKLVFTLLKLII